MNRTKPPKPKTPVSYWPPPGRMQPGTSLDIKLYRRFKAQAALEGRPVSQLFDDAMNMYLDAKETSR